MKLQFHIPDHVYEKYVVKFGVKGAYDRMRQVLEEMQEVDPKDRYVLLHGDERRAIEKVFQTVVDSPQKLHKLVDRLHKVNVAGVASIEYTSDELERLKAQAEFHGRTFEQFMHEQANEIRQFMLDQV